MSILFFILGFIFLIKGADFLVDGSSALAKKMQISDLVIGLTIVAFGTSAPELVVNIFASLNKTAEIAVGNILGSNICNILLILGISSLIYPLKVKKNTVWKEIPFCLLGTVLIGFMANDALIDHFGFSVLTRIDGFVLLSFFAIFMYYIFGISKVGNNGKSEIKEQKIFKIFFFIAAGFSGLIIGGKLVIDSAINLATLLGVSTSLIGLTIVAIGTSLPELVTSAVSAFKKNSDIAIGNVVGSNIFNIFFILGISSILNPLTFHARNNADILVAIFASLLLFVIMFVGKKHLLERWQGFLFISCYFVYIAFLITRK